MARLRVLFVVSECVPIVKTGGLGDVAAALPAALLARGHDVRVLMPRYRQAKGHPAQPTGGPLGVPLGTETVWTAVHEGRLPGEVPVYLLEHDALYDREGIYGDEGGDYLDNARRFALLSAAALALEDHLDWRPDVLHVNDWQASLAAVYARLRRSAAPTVLSVHNLGYQGRVSGHALGMMGLRWAEAVAAGLESYGHLNLLQGGIASATMLSTVSPRYAAEVQTADGGVGLDGALRARGSDMVGILNGIDERAWDPRADPHLPACYGPEDLAGKAACKAALQRELGMPVRPEVPLVGLVSRFAHQKGIDVFAGALERLLEEDLQLAILGSGEGWAERLFSDLAERFPQLGARIGVDEGLAHRIEAGADFFVMPSRYEPCGLNQMYSQRYGTLPIVRGVGGLLDTVEHEETGLVFHRLSSDALVGAVLYAAHLYRHHPEHFHAMQRAGMSKSMGWDRSAAQYEALYRLAVRRKRQRGW